MDSEAALQQAIGTISQSDPIVKLLQQVKLGRMKPADVGLRAIVEAWLATYEKVLATPGLTKAALDRINPSPRVAVLIEAGVLKAAQPVVQSLESAFARALAQAPSE